MLRIETECEVYGNSVLAPQFLCKSKTKKENLFKNGKNILKIFKMEKKKNTLVHSFSTIDRKFEFSFICNFSS